MYQSSQTVTAINIPITENLKDVDNGIQHRLFLLVDNVLYHNRYLYNINVNKYCDMSSIIYCYGAIYIEIDCGTALTTKYSSIMIFDSLLMNCLRIYFLYESSNWIIVHIHTST